MATSTVEMYKRKNVRRGNQMLRLRRELRALDDKSLLRRLGKYMGRTASEVRAEYRVSSGNSLAAYGRKDAVIDAIVHYEIP